MARKVFIACLGTSFYTECKYAIGVNVSDTTRYIQKATLQLLKANEWSSEDKGVILLTDKAQTCNWQVDNNKRVNHRTKQEECYYGLYDEFSSMNLPFQIEGTHIPEGGNEEEIWKIFNIIYAQLNDGDEVYFDITHAFRYLPLLIIVLGNYSKFLKNITIRSITYGNIENMQDGIAPIVNLLPLAALQDWTNAADNYINFGNVDKLVDLSKNTLHPILVEAKGQNINARNLNLYIKGLDSVIKERQLCRGKDIIQGDSVKRTRNMANQFENTFIPPLNPIISAINDSIDMFDNENGMLNGFQAALWCTNNNLYQQGVTICHENIVTYICHKAGFEWSTESSRKPVNNALDIFDGSNTLETFMGKPEEWRLALNPDATDDAKEQRKKELRMIFSLPQFAELAKLYNELRIIRNDFNHSGIRKHPMSASRMPGKIRSIISEVVNLVIGNMTPPQERQGKRKIFYNLSNHPSLRWDRSQLDAAEAIGQIIDAPFPQIAPDADDNDLDNLVAEHFQSIQQLSEDSDITVHIMGEMVFVHRLVIRLKDIGIKCIASTTVRDCREDENGNKVSCFRFMRFRVY